MLLIIQPESFVSVAACNICVKTWTSALGVGVPAHHATKCS